MTHPLVRRLQNYAPLSPDEQSALAAASAEVAILAPREDLILEGQSPVVVRVLLSGFAARHKTLADGRRQILAYMVPGDLCEPHLFVLSRMDHSVSTVTAATVGVMQKEALGDVARAFPRLGEAFWWQSQVDAAVAREWVVNIGQRTAYERTAHLFCEMFHRLQAMGLTRGQRCELPMTQTELGEAMGLSAVHVNRTLQELRREKLISLEDRELTIHDLPALEAAALFDAAYLHLQPPAN